MLVTNAQELDLMVERVAKHRPSMQPSIKNKWMRYFAQPPSPLRMRVSR